MRTWKRTNEYVSRRQGTNFLAAHRFAEQIGRRLNLAVTLNFSHTTCDPTCTSEAFERLRDNHFSRWLRYRSQKAQKAGRRPFGAPTHAWVIEAKDGYQHVHWNLHMPTSLEKEFLKRLPKWLEKAAGKIEMPLGVIHSQPITDFGYSRYCMKGLEPHHAKARWVRPEAQGTVVGKRCGTSLNLGPSARKRHRTALRLAA